MNWAIFRRIRLESFWEKLCINFCEQKCVKLLTFGNNYLCVKTAKWTNCWNSQAGQNKMLLGTYNYNIRVPLQIWRDQTALVKIKFFKWIQNQLFCNLKEEIKVQFIMCELKTYLYMATSLVNNRHSRQKRKKLLQKCLENFKELRLLALWPTSSQMSTFNF